MQSELSTDNWLPPCKRYLTSIEVLSSYLAQPAWPPGDHKITILPNFSVYEFTANAHNETAQGALPIPTIGEASVLLLVVSLGPMV